MQRVLRAAAEKRAADTQIVAQIVAQIVDIAAAAAVGTQTADTVAAAAGTHQT